MSTTTTKLGLILPAESDPASIGDINDNMKAIDKLVHIVESGTVNADVYGRNGSATTDTDTQTDVTWYYKKYDDGTFSAYCNYQTTDLFCNGNSAAPYYSGVRTVYTPVTKIGITAIKDCQIHVAGNYMNWVMNITGKTVYDRVEYRLASLYYENMETEQAKVGGGYKQHYIHIEGTWSK